MKFFLKWSMAISICCVEISFGQTNGVHYMPEVVVSGDRDQESRKELWRTPGGVGLITSEEIEKTRASNLKDILNMMPGVYIQPRQGSADENILSIRGSGIRNGAHLRGVRLYLDGMLMSNADGFSDFDTVELLALDRIEVFKGANGLEIGANSLGGGINFVSKDGFNADRFKIRKEWGSFGFAKGQLSSGQNFKDGMDYYVSTTAQREDGYRRHQDLERERLYGNLGWKVFDDTLVRFYLSAVNSRNELAGNLTKSQLQLAPQSAAAANITLNQRRDTEVVRTAFSSVHRLDLTQKLEANVYYQWKDLDHPLGFGFIDNEFNDVGVEARYVNAHEIIDHENEFVFGVTPQYGRILDANYANNGGSRGAITKLQVDETYNMGAWVQDRYSFDEHCKFVVGTRFDWSSRCLRDRFLSDGNASGELNYSGFSPRLGTIYEFNREVQAYGNLSMAYEPPVFSEQTLSNTSGLVNLQPQKSYQFEIGTRGKWRKVDWDLSIYNAEIEDELFSNNLGNTGLSLLSNTPRTRHTGIEVGGGYKVWEGLLEKGEAKKQKDYIKISTSYTWSDFWIVSDGIYTGKRLPGVPENFWVSKLSYDHPGGFSYGFKVETTPDAYFVDKANNLQNDGYTVFGMDASMEFKNGLRIFGELRNITDVTYASAVSVTEAATATSAQFKPADGFAMYGGVEWKY
jgi:iron complex outermembrane recepter protein